MRSLSYLALTFAFVVGCAQEGPGVYEGDPSLSCNEICSEQSLVCDEDHVWGTDLFGNPRRGGGERIYRISRFDTASERFPCETVTPDTLERSGETYEGTDDYECACILPGGDAGVPADAGVPDVPMDVVRDVFPDVEQNTPGFYPGDVEDLRSCESICRDEGLTCDARHRWDVERPGPGDPGGAQTTYENGGSPDTQGWPCQYPPQAVQPPNMELEGELQSYRCACIVNDSAGDLLNEVEQGASRGGGDYQGFFTVTEPTTVSYDIVDGYRDTPNRWTVAIVPSESIEAYLTRPGPMEGPLVYGQTSRPSSGTNATVDLPAGDYALVLQCFNQLQGCYFHTRVVAD
ncbi:MAG: hypothetical protein ACI9KE_000242 [Polyangiales bacterium]|jgi:hypothetical protein